MQLKEIDKTQYRKHLKMVFAGIASTMVVIALGVSNLLIYLLSNPENAYFYHNLAGVAVAGVVVVIMLNKLRQHPYMLEVVYVWDLKQQLNRIQRKLRKIEAAIENNDKDAMIIMNFMYRGSKQLYELDDNIITMEDLLRKTQILDERMQAAGVSLSTELFDVEMLGRF